MPTLLKPLTPFPALIIENSEKALVATDLHIGWEREWSENGIYIPSQAHKLVRRILEVIEECEPDRLILLGDIKQAITRVSREGWREIPEFFEKILIRLGDVGVILGNHDAELMPLTPPEIKIHPSRGIALGSQPRVGLFHGHAWPSLKVLSSDILVMGHIHPVVWFRDNMGLWTIKQVWLKAKFRRELMAEAYLKHLNASGGEEELKAFSQDEGAARGSAKLIIVPAFNDMIGGVSINRLENRLMGPILRSGGVNLQEAEVYLLDGTYLGMIKQLQEYVDG